MLRLKDELSGAEWQKVRNGQLHGDGEIAPVPELLSDDMPMAAWQQARNRQAGLGYTELGAAGAGGGAEPKFNVDWDFIRQKEGWHADMRVPNENGVVIGKSGPTIGSGFDLGQRNSDDLKKLGLRPETEAKLKPYLGKRGQEALDFVRANPLTIPKDEVNEVNTAIRKRELNEIARKFDASSQIGRFQDLPGNTQTAITSLYFQHGIGNPEKSTPNYWRQITNGEWEDAHKNLRAFGDAHQTDRRDPEADLLMRDIKAGTLPRKPR